MSEVMTTKIHIGETIPSSEDIVILARKNPIVTMCMKHYLNGGFSYVDMLRTCVITLAKVNEDQHDMLVDAVSKSPQGFI